MPAMVQLLLKRIRTWAGVVGKAMHRFDTKTLLKVKDKISAFKFDATPPGEICSRNDTWGKCVILIPASPSCSFNNLVQTNHLAMMTGNNWHHHSYLSQSPTFNWHYQFINSLHQCLSLVLDWIESFTSWSLSWPIASPSISSFLFFVEVDILE